MNWYNVSFDDVLIKPKYSKIRSRKDINTDTTFLGSKYKLPVVSSNMDTVTGVELAIEMILNGAAACLHRFWSIEENVEAFETVLEAIGNSKVDLKDYNKMPWVSVGTGTEEFKRAQALAKAGAKVFVIDVAHGATVIMKEQYEKMRSQLPNDIKIIIGNFANSESYLEWESMLTEGMQVPDSLKISVGSGSACSTRIVTGCGQPALGSLFDFVDNVPGMPLICDGGMRQLGDFCKVIASGAAFCMTGSFFAGTKEAAGEEKRVPCDGVDADGSDIVTNLTTKKIEWYQIYKKYRGSASAESYEVQNKVAEHRTPEGESMWIRFKGPLKDVLQSLNAGFRSSMSYVGAITIEQYQNNARFIQITQSGIAENSAHGKK